jgi:hypothetical protein
VVPIAALTFFSRKREISKKNSKTSLRRRSHAPVPTQMCEIPERIFRGDRETVGGREEARAITTVAQHALLIESLTFWRAASGCGGCGGCGGAARADPCANHDQHARGVAVPGGRRLGSEPAGATALGGWCCVCHVVRCWGGRMRGATDGFAALLLSHLTIHTLFKPSLTQR